MTPFDDTTAQSPKKFVKQEYRSWKIDQLPTPTNDDVMTDVTSSQIAEQVIPSVAPVINAQSSNDMVNATAKNKQVESNGLLSKEDIIALVKELVGLQEMFFYLVLENCNANKTLQTNRLKMADIAEMIQRNSNTAKYAINKVVSKGLVKRLKGRGSFNSFVQFAITKEVRKIGNVLMAHKRENNIEFDKFLTKARKIGSLMDWYNDLSKKSNISIDDPKNKI
jgi:DNA-binding MarR family transcriptional regulator